MRTLELVLGDRSFSLELEERDGRLSMSLAGEPLEFDLGRQTEGGLSLLLNHRSFEAQVRVDDREVTVELDGERYVFEILARGLSRKLATDRGPGGQAEVRAPMPGKVVKLLAAPGDTVEAGQGVLLFEAMKMQNEIRSPLAGQVVAVAVQEGQAVEAREGLFTVKAGP
ncbi:MAG: biotin/lipoyl-containing protein [Acidobacteriota bacterium]